MVLVSCQLTNLEAMLRGLVSRVEVNLAGCVTAQGKPFYVASTNKHASVQPKQSKSTKVMVLLVMSVAFDFLELVWTQNQSASSCCGTQVMQSQKIGMLRPGQLLKSSI